MTSGGTVRWSLVKRPAFIAGALRSGMARVDVRNVFAKCTLAAVTAGRSCVAGTLCLEPVDRSQVVRTVDISNPPSFTEGAAIGRAMQYVDLDVTRLLVELRGWLVAQPANRC